MKKANFGYGGPIKGLKKGKSSEFNPRHDGDLSGWPTPL